MTAQIKIANGASSSVAWLTLQKHNIKCDVADNGVLVILKADIDRARSVLAYSGILTRLL